MIMCVLLVEWLCQAVTGQILALKCLLSDACGRLRLRPVVSSIKCRRFPWSRLWLCLPCTKTPWVKWLGAQARPEPGGEAERAVRWQDPDHPRLTRWENVLAWITLKFSSF
jgi:hypothetical protein